MCCPPTCSSAAPPMAETGNRASPPRLQPRPEQLRFDLAAALQCVVLVHAEIPEDAFTAAILGTERIGHGTVIGADGLVLTIGYLITEAESIWLTTNDGTVVPGHALAYDQVTGFGLVLPLGRLGAPSIERGSAASTRIGDSVIVIGHGGLGRTLEAKGIARREVAGCLAYLLGGALFPARAHPRGGGGAGRGAGGPVPPDLADRTCRDRDPDDAGARGEHCACARRVR